MCRNMNKYFLCVCSRIVSMNTFIKKKDFTKLWTHENYSNLLIKSKKVYKVLKSVNMLFLHIFLMPNHHR